MRNRHSEGLKESAIIFLSILCNCSAPEKIKETYRDVGVSFSNKKWENGECNVDSFRMSDRLNTHPISDLHSLSNHPSLGTLFLTLNDFPLIEDRHFSNTDAKKRCIDFDTKIKLSRLLCAKLKTILLDIARRGFVEAIQYPVLLFPRPRSGVPA